jgi:hypothetical protein
VPEQKKGRWQVMLASRALYKNEGVLRAEGNDQSCCDQQSVAIGLLMAVIPRCH